MQRRTVLARGVAVTAIGIAAAGCSSDGESDEDEADGADETEDEADGADETEDGNGGGGGSSGGEASASASLSSEVDELELVSSRYTDNGIEGRYPVTVTVRNNGDQETNIEEYSYEYTVSDSSGSDITGGTSSTSDNPTVAPGETTEILLTVIVDGDPENVASYSVTLGCGSFGGGVYCEES